MAVKNFAPAATSGGFRIVARSSDRGEIYLYGPIGADWFGEGVSAKQFADDMKKLSNAKTIDLRINSEGGDVFAGKAMYTLLSEHKAKIIVHIDGLAASAASYIAMAGDEIRIAKSAFVMIHNAWTMVVGGADDFRKQADILEQVNDSICDVYVARTGKSKDQCKIWMDAETWFTGNEAVQHGFADKVAENMRVAATVRDPSKFKNLPSSLLPRRSAALATIASLTK